MPGPLRCSIEGDEIVIRISIDVLAHAAENHPDMFEVRDSAPRLRVCDKAVFAKDVVDEIEREDEDGSSMMSRMFDRAAIDAWENGSLGCED